jgi:hypothetical protein
MFALESTQHCPLIYAHLWLKALLPTGSFPMQLSIVEDTGGPSPRQLKAQGEAKPSVQRPDRLHSTIALLC